VDDGEGAAAAAARASSSTALRWVLGSGEARMTCGSVGRVVVAAARVARHGATLGNGWRWRWSRTPARNFSARRRNRGGGQGGKGEKGWGV
jgi:hypothetical protein